MRNEKGPVAETYLDLQGIAHLERAVRETTLPNASPASFLRTVLQSAEILIYGLADLYLRAADDLRADNVSEGVVKLEWARGIHRLLSQLVCLPEGLPLSPETIPAKHGGEAGAFRCGESRARIEFLHSLQRFDAAVLAMVERNAVGESPSLQQALESTIERGLPTDPLVRLLHLARNGNLEARLWERALEQTMVLDVTPPPETYTYAALIGSRWLRKAVFGLRLKGDTYFLQFRILHQVPELLASEASRHLLAVVADLEMPTIPTIRVLDRLRRAALLTEGLTAALYPLLDGLLTREYHAIRENLGQTSGSHSVNLHFDLFNARYVETIEAITRWVVRSDSNEGRTGAEGGASLDAQLRRLAFKRAEDEGAWALCEALGLCMAIRDSISAWRNLHIGLPRNNLGAGGAESVRSLVGSRDALSAVRRMAEAASRRGERLPLVRALRCRDASPLGRRTIDDYVQNDDSLDAYVLRATGEVTCRAFPHVQDRTGYFSMRCPFGETTDQPPSDRPLPPATHDLP